MLLALVTLLLAPATTQPKHDQALATFDRAWEIIHEQHFDPAFNGVDWPGVRDELRPRAAQARDESEVRKVIRAMLERLGQSHFSLVEREVLRDGPKGAHAGTVGLDLRWIGERAFVRRVEPGSPAEAAGVRSGWQLLEVGGEGVEACLEEARRESRLRPETGAWQVLTSRVDGPVGSRAAMTFLDAWDQPRSCELQRVERDAVVFDMPGLPSFFLEMESGILERGESRIGVVSFSNWFRPISDEVDAALLGLRDCTGIVIDLRSNTGGEARMVRDVCGHFFAERTSLGKEIKRHSTRDYTIRPRDRFGPRRVEPFLGPLAILVDETTGSSSEVFSGGLQALGRARVFGSPTAGAALPATTTRLPNGDYLLHAIADFRTCRGRSLEGSGVRPDEEVPLTRADLLAGRDAALASAAAWIETETR